jgi:TonB-linked SusC/RagA family outer membrane protein
MKIYCTIFFLICSTFIFSQEIKVTGTVYDSSGNPLGNASIFIEGTKTGTIADFDGNFSITVPNELSKLVISFIGFVSQKLSIGVQKKIIIKMKPNTQSLEEIVVVGYGKVKKGDLTGAVSSIKAKDITSSGAVSIEQALAGKSAGVIVTQSSGMPGAGANIKIRGINSLNGSNPLYVIDGTPINNSSAGSLNSEDESSGNISPLSMINPADIQSIEILKDASATAIYGSRGANGVILITTKTGKIGKGVIYVDHDYSTNQNIRMLPVLDSNEFWLTRNQANLNAGNTNLYSQQKQDSARAGLFRSTNWQKAVFRTGNTSNTNVNFSGGNKDIKYLVSTNLLNAKGIVEKTDFTRISNRINLDAIISDKIKIGTRTYYALIDSDQQSTSTNFTNTAGLNSIIQRAIRTPSFVGLDALSTDDGVEVYTPTLALEGNDFNNKISQYLINAYATYNFSKDFEFKSVITYQNRSTAQRFYQKNIFPAAFSRRGWAKTSDIKVALFTNTNTLEFKKRFGKHNISGVLGQSTESFEFEMLRISNHGFPNDLLTYYDPGSATFNDPDVIQFQDSKLASYFGRLNYNYRNKFLVTLTGRYDGSSRFAENNKWAFFPAAAVAYKLSNEKFIKEISSISNLKLRLSYGLSGNQVIQPYQSLSQLQSGQIGFGDGNGGEGLNTIYYNNQLPNANLSWETTAQFDAGMDFGLFNNRLNGTFDYYSKKTDDLLFNNQITIISGFRNFYQNFGSLESYGYELSLNGDILSKDDFSWNLGINASTGKTKITSLTFDKVNSGYNQGWIAGGTQRLIVGEEVGAFFGYQTSGITQFDDFIEFQNLSRPEQIALYESDPAASYTFVDGFNRGLPINATRNQPGEQLYTDNGDGELNEEDKRVIGTAQPEISFGINSNFTFGNFEFNFFIDGQLGQDLVNVANFQLLAFDGSQQLNTVLNAWTPENSSNTYPRLNALNIGASPFVFSDRFVEDASFVRLQNVNIAYNFGEDVLGKLNLTQLQIFVSGTNLHVWTNYSGFNPDVSLTGSNTLALGHDNGGYPIARSLRMGLKLKF